MLNDLVMLTSVVGLCLFFFLQYNRTAEREAELIRPLPILEKTMDYLLGLLDQPYDDGFLRLYNFMWDRMRAIRMDLRMQHIFNDRAITMLEQMVCSNSLLSTTVNSNNVGEIIVCH